MIKSYRDYDLIDFQVKFLTAIYLADISTQISTNVYSRPPCIISCVSLQELSVYCNILFAKYSFIGK